MLRFFYSLNLVQNIKLKLHKDYIGGFDSSMSQPPIFYYSRGPPFNLNKLSFKLKGEFL